MNSYERLEAWKAAHQFVLAIHRATRAFPSEELRYTLRLVKDLDLITAEEFAVLENQRDRVGRLTWGLYRSMRRAIAAAES